MQFYLLVGATIAVLLGQSRPCDTDEGLQGLNGVIKAANWKRMVGVVLCDSNTKECVKQEEAMLDRPFAKFMTLDLSDISIIVRMFENISKLTRMNWLVFCSDCLPLLSVINQYESSHQLLGYFTHLYQWILVTNFTAAKSDLELSAGKITNLAFIDTDERLNHEVYTSMFGNNGTRYFDHIGNVSDLSKQCNGTGDIFPNLKHGLNALELRLTAMPWSPFIIKHENGSYNGYYIQLLHMLAEQLNFTFTFRGPPDGQYGLLDPTTGEWTGMIRQLIDDQADIAGVLTYSEQRNGVVDQPNQAVDVDYGLIVYHNEPPIFMSIELLIKPFSQNVWLCFLGVMLVTSAAFALAQRWGKYGIKQAFTVFGNCTYIFRSTLNQGSPIDPQNTSSRMIYSTYALGWIILMASYSAHLVALLSVQIDNVPFQTMLEVAENTDYKLGMIGGTLTYSQFMLGEFSANNALGKLQAKMIHDSKEDPTILSTNYASHIDLLENEKYALYTTRSDYESIATTSCAVAPLKERGYVLFNGFMLQKNSVYTGYFSEILRHVQEGNLDNKIRRNFWPKPMQCELDYDPTVRIGNLLGIFYILVGGVCIAFCVLVLEIMLDTFCKNKDTFKVQRNNETPSTSRYNTTHM